MIARAHRPARSAAAQRASFVLLVLLGTTAVGGGLAMLSGVLATDPALLAGSVFPDYTVPALSLTAVGVLSCVAAVLVWRRHGCSAAASASSGLGIVIFEAVEVVVIGPHPLQAAYALVGLALIGLAPLVHPRWPRDR